MWAGAGMLDSRRSSTMRMMLKSEGWTRRRAGTRRRSGEELVIALLLDGKVT